MIHQPEEQVLLAGSSAELHADVAGTKPMYFQWRRGATLLPDATNNLLRIDNISSNETGMYTLIISNQFGLAATTQVPISLALPPEILAHPVPLTAYAGTNIQISVRTAGPVPPHYQWFYNGAPLSAETNSILHLPNARQENSGLYDVQVSNSFGSVRSRSAPVVILPLDAPGTRYTNFTPTIFAPGFVRQIISSPPDKLLVAGAFVTAGSNPRKNIVRIYFDGSTDSSFEAPDLAGPTTQIECINFSQDGKILVGGNLDIFREDRVWRKIARFNVDGSLDQTFAPNETLPDFGSGSHIKSLALQTDGRIIVGGFFTNLNGAPLNGLARLNPNGSVDPTFHFLPGIAGQVEMILLQNDRILIGGAFTNVHGEQRLGIARLLSNGDLDPEFAPGENFGRVLQAIPLPPQSYVVAGMFTPGTLAMISNGLRDPTFDAQLPSIFSSPESAALALALQPDGKLLVGPNNRSGIIRLNRDGSLDKSFYAPNSVEFASTITLLPDGSMIIGGYPSGKGPALVRLNGGDLDGFPRIVSQPTTSTARVGSTVTLSVEATGLPPLAYQWAKANQILNDQTSPTLILTNIASSDAASYTAIVSNIYGETKSAAVDVHIKPEIKLEFLAIHLFEQTLDLRLAVPSNTSLHLHLDYSTNLFTWHRLLDTNTFGPELLLQTTANPLIKSTFYRIGVVSP